MTEKLRYAYDHNEGFIVDMGKPPAEDANLGTELLQSEVVDLLNALEQRVERLEQELDGEIARANRAIAAYNAIAS